MMSNTIHTTCGSVRGKGPAVNGGDPPRSFLLLLPLLLDSRSCWRRRLTASATATTTGRQRYMCEGRCCVFVNIFLTLMLLLLPLFPISTTTTLRPSYNTTPQPPLPRQGLPLVCSVLTGASAAAINAAAAAVAADTKIDRKTTKSNNPKKKKKNIKKDKRPMHAYGSVDININTALLRARHGKGDTAVVVPPPPIASNIDNHNDTINDDSTAPAGTTSTTAGGAAILALPTGVLFATHIAFNTTSTTTNASSSSSSTYTITNNRHFLYGPFGRRAFPTTTTTVRARARAAAAGGIGPSVSTSLPSSSSSSSSSTFSDSAAAAASSTTAASASAAAVGVGPLLAPSCADVTSLRYYTPTTAFMFPVPPSQKIQPPQPSSTSAAAADVGGPLAIVKGTCHQQQHTGLSLPTATSSTSTSTRRMQRRIDDSKDDAANADANAPPVVVTAIAPVVVSLQEDAPVDLPQALVAPMDEILDNIESALGQASFVDNCAVVSQRPRRWWPVADLSALRAAVPAPPAPPSPPAPAAPPAAPFTNTTIPVGVDNNNSDGSSSDNDDTGGNYLWTLVAAYAQPTIVDMDDDDDGNGSETSTINTNTAAPLFFSLNVSAFGYTCVGGNNNITTTTRAATTRAATTTNTTSASTTRSYSSSPPSPTSSWSGCDGEGSASTSAVAMPVYRLSSLVLAYAFVQVGGGAGGEGEVAILAATVFLGGLPYTPSSSSSSSSSIPPPVSPVTFKGLVGGGDNDYGNTLSYGFLGNFAVRVSLPSDAYTAAQRDHGGWNMLKYAPAPPPSFSSSSSSSSCSNNNSDSNSEESNTADSGTIACSCYPTTSTNCSTQQQQQQQCLLVTPPRMADSAVPRWSRTIEGSEFVSFGASCVDYIAAGGYVGLTNTPEPEHLYVSLHESDYFLLSVVPPSSSSSSSPSSSPSSSAPSSSTWLFPADVVFNDLFDGLGGSDLFDSSDDDGDGDSDASSDSDSDSGDNAGSEDSLRSSIIPPSHNNVYKFGLYASFNLESESVTLTANTIFAPYPQNLASLPRTANIESVTQWVQATDSPNMNFPTVCPWLVPSHDYNRKEKDLCLGPILGISINTGSASRGTTSSSSSNCLGPGTLRSVAVSFNPSLVVAAAADSGDDSSATTTTTTTKATTSSSKGPLLTSLPAGECVLLGQLLASVQQSQGGFFSAECAAIVAPPLPRDSLGFASAYLRQNIKTLGSMLGQGPVATPWMASCQNLPPSGAATTTPTTSPTGNATITNASSSSSSSWCPRWPSPYPIIGDTLPLDYQGPPPADQAAFLTNEETWCAFNQYLAGTPTAPTMGVTFLCSADRKTVYVVTCGEDHFPSPPPPPLSSSDVSSAAVVDFDAPSQGPPMVGSTWGALWSYWVATNTAPSSSSSTTLSSSSSSSSTFWEGSARNTNNTNRIGLQAPPYYAGLGGVPLMAFDAVNDPSGFQFHCSACTPFIEAGIGPLPYAAVAIAALKEALLVAIGVWIMSFRRLQHGMAAAVAWLSSLVVPFTDGALSRRLQKTVAESLRTCDEVAPVELVQSARSFITFAVKSASIAASSTTAAVPQQRGGTSAATRQTTERARGKGEGGGGVRTAFLEIKSKREAEAEETRESKDTGEGYFEEIRGGGGKGVKDNMRNLFEERSFEAFFLYYVLRGCQKKVNTARLVQWLDEKRSRRNDESGEAGAAGHHLLQHTTAASAPPCASLTIDRRWEMETEHDYLSAAGPPHSASHPPLTSLLAVPQEKVKDQDDDDDDDDRENDEDDDETVELLSRAAATHKAAAKRLAALQIAHDLCALRATWGRFLHHHHQQKQKRCRTQEAHHRQDGETTERVRTTRNGGVEEERCGANYSMTTAPTCSMRSSDKNDDGDGNESGAEVSTSSYYPNNPCDVPLLLPTQEEKEENEVEGDEHTTYAHGEGSRGVAVTIGAKSRRDGIPSSIEMEEECAAEACRASLSAATRALWEALESQNLLDSVAFADTSIDHRITPPAWLLLMHLLFCVVYMIVILVSVVRAHDLRCENASTSLYNFGATSDFHCVLASGWVVYQAIFFRYMNSTASVSLIVNAIIRVLYQPLPPPELGGGGEEDEGGGENVNVDDNRARSKSPRSSSSNLTISSSFFGPSEWDLVMRAGCAAVAPSPSMGGRQKRAREAVGYRTTTRGGVPVVVRSTSRHIGGDDGSRGESTTMPYYDDLYGESDLQHQQQQQSGSPCGGSGGDHVDNRRGDAAMVAVLRRGDCIDTKTTLRSIARRCVRDRFFQCGVLLPLPVLLTHALVGAVLYAWVTIPVIGLLVLVAVSLDRIAMPPPAVFTTGGLRKGKGKEMRAYSKEREEEREKEEKEEREEKEDYNNPTLTCMGRDTDTNDEDTENTADNNQHQSKHDEAANATNVPPPRATATVLRIVSARLAVRVLITFTCVLLCQTTVNWMVLAYTGGSGNARLAYTFERFTDTFYRQAQQPGMGGRVPNTFLYRHRFPPPPSPANVSNHQYNDDDTNNSSVPQLFATAGTAAAVERLQDAQYVSYLGVLTREFQSRNFACSLEMLAATLGGAMQSVSVLF